MAAPSVSASSDVGTFRSRYFHVISGRARGVFPTFYRLGLLLLSGLYCLAARLRQLCYDQGWIRAVRVSVPVVSVGNLTVGGTGKTPMVEYVADYYRQRDLRVAILSRGYGTADGCNDEALVLEENLPDVPHLQGPKRSQLAQVAVEELESEVLVLDDGFQHRRLARDLDLVLIDATSPWGYGYLLPRGLLREPPSGLRRAGGVLITRCDQADPQGIQKIRKRLEHLAPQVPIILTRHYPVELLGSDQRRQSLDLLRQHPVAAFSGIGNPEAFKRTLLDLGASLQHTRWFPDHHVYTREDVADLIQWAGSLPSACIVVTTQKDLVKLRLTSLGDRALWALRIRLQVEEGEERLHDLLHATVACLDSSPSRDARGEADFSPG